MKQQRPLRNIGTVSAIIVSEGNLGIDFLKTGHKNFHQRPCKKIGERANREYDHIGRGLGFEACESKSVARSGRIVEQHAGTLIHYI